MVTSTTSINDTIAAISTALGEGGIAIVRISGPDAVNISAKILSRKVFEIPGKLYLTSLLDDENNILDRVLAANFRSPQSYTGEDIVEIHTHGGILLARLCLELVLKNGARVAEPGEFTRRAFVNGRMDLSQAEGVLSLIKSRSIEALHAAAKTLTGELSRAARKIHDDILRIQSSVEINLDFPEGDTFSNSDIPQEIHEAIHELEELISRCNTGMILREGIKVVIAGSPNVGKSSLLNALVGKNRAIVTEIPGTTRDIITENIIISGIPVTLTDTAGLRDSQDIIEAEGIKLAHEAMSESDICIYVIDCSRELTAEELNYISSVGNHNAMIVFNKSDLEIITCDVNINAPKIFVSAKNYTGIEDLKREIYNIAAKNSVLSSGLNVSSGQLEDLRTSLYALNEAYNSAKNFMGEDITAGMLNSARVNLVRVLGIDAGDELLESMFSRFCVGK